MKTLAPIPPSAKRLFLATLLLAAAMPAAVPALAQVPAARIAGEVSSSERAHSTTRAPRPGTAPDASPAAPRSRA